ncbi:MAG: L-rhamnose/proton symporter RhaT [Planctomycetes bacterium]|nr:L-rhamnose/proton symporter RhaT [Planctomycetota bacterium]
MVANPFLGVFFHWLGGLAAGSFYAPYRRVQQWAWEVYWLVGGFFSWIIAPWVIATLWTNDLVTVLREAPASALGWGYFWGLMWGLGGLTFGLTMRYLGMSLGMAVALSYCSAFGTLMPPLFNGTLVQKFSTTSGHWIGLGIIVCLVGIVVTGLAGISKDREMPEDKKKEVIKEFSFWKGIAVATFSGILSASFAYGLDAAAPIAELSAQHGTTTLWTGLPKLCVVLLGGFTTNFIWCVLLNYKNGTGHQYFRPAPRREMPPRGAMLEAIVETPIGEAVVDVPATAVNAVAAVPMLANYLFCALAGVTWYMQFFFYTMGETQMGQYKFSSWTLHMASIIIFSSLWGIALKEWRGSSGGTKRKLALGLALLILSTMIIGYGNYLGARPPAN